MINRLTLNCMQTWLDYRRMRKAPDPKARAQRYVLRMAADTPKLARLIHKDVTGEYASEVKHIMNIGDGLMSEFIEAIEVALHAT